MRSDSSSDSEEGLTLTDSVDEVHEDLEQEEYIKTYPLRRVI